MDSRIFGREKPINTCPVRSDGIRVLVVCGVWPKFEPGDVDNLLKIVWCAESRKEGGCVLQKQGATGARLLEKCRT
jgi:hypothetical protein